MTRREQARNDRGYFAIGVYRPKTAANIGTLWRTATLSGAALIFPVGERYQRQPSDTPKTWRHIPLLHFADLDDLVEHLPFSAPLVGVELDERAKPLWKFAHPERAVYLLGAEDDGLPPAVLKRCHHVIQIESDQAQSMNVATAGAVITYHRHMTRGAA